VWRGGEHGEAERLASCYRRSLELAAEKGAKSLAFPAISTGVYGFPAEKAAKIAVQTVREALKGLAGPMEVVFCCFSQKSADFHQKWLAEVEQDPAE